MLDKYSTTEVHPHLALLIWMKSVAALKDPHMRRN